MRGMLLIALVVMSCVVCGGDEAELDRVVSLGDIRCPLGNGKTGVGIADCTWTEREIYYVEVQAFAEAVAAGGRNLERPPTPNPATATTRHWNQGAYLEVLVRTSAGNTYTARAEPGTTVAVGDEWPPD